MRLRDASANIFQKKKTKNPPPPPPPEQNPDVNPALGYVNDHLKFMAKNFIIFTLNIFSSHYDQNLHLFL